MNDLVEQLEQRLSEPLPGRDAQSRFEPELSFGRHFSDPPPDARWGAVLALLYRHQERWHVPLTVRPQTMVDHAGQVSFPGGLIEEGEDSQEAALRELEEELGVPPREIRLLGKLSPLYLFVSNFWVQPWVAVVDHRPEWQPDRHEVAELLEVPLEHLLDPANRGTHQRDHRGLQFSVPHINFENHYVWGATSMMLNELTSLVEGIAC
jgi:8-oxo-dGTP pyrophosphatase MutT (NUDIX family)